MTIIDKAKEVLAVEIAALERLLKQKKSSLLK